LENDNNIDIALRLITRINQQNLDGLLELLAEFHTFNAIDRQVSDIDRATAREVWRQFFNTCPDYMIHLSDVIDKGETTILVLRTTGSHLNLPLSTEFQTKLIWVLKIEDNLISGLSIFLDDNRIREELNIY